MLIRKYGEWPAFFVPDLGEVVLAARSPAGPFLRAVVTKVRRASRGKIRVRFEYREDADHTACEVPIRAGDLGIAYIATDDVVPLIRRLPARPRPRPVRADETERGPDVTAA